MSPSLVRFLNGFLRIEISFLSRLAEINLSTPATVINAFGLDRNSIATTFTQMGPSYVFPQQLHDQTTKLIMVARALVLNFHFHKPKKVKKSWQQLKKTSSFNQLFENFNDNELKRVEAFIQDPTNHSLALQEMRHIRKLIRLLLKHDDSSIASNKSKASQSQIPMQQFM